MKTSLFSTLANLLEYPGDDWHDRVELASRVSNALEPLEDAGFQDFLRALEHVPKALLEERYTQTFDLNPVCTLEIGYHLFGENYKRGLFLTKLSEVESTHGVAADGQLPDYLPVVLRLLDAMPDGELRHDLITECLLPGLEKMSEALAKNGSVYALLIGVVQGLLKEEVALRSAVRQEDAKFVGTGQRMRPSSSHP